MRQNFSSPDLQILILSFFPGPRFQNLFIVVADLS